MKDSQPGFDRFAALYEELLNDQIRSRFARGSGGFFHVRKHDLIRDYFRRRQTDMRKLSYLDLGCGKGELVSLLRSDFARVAACDPSEGMLKAGALVAKGIETRVQDNPGRIPFATAEFDFITAVCVCHHVPPPARAVLLRETRRVLRRGGTLAIIEHNPYNPVTRLIVSRTPVDAEAILLRPAETRRLLREARFAVDDLRYFLYFPEFLFRWFSRLEAALSKIPLGGQYVVFGRSV
jgi:SAM-dependent methyltransferase